MAFVPVAGRDANPYRPDQHILVMSDGRILVKVLKADVIEIVLI